MPPSKGGSRAPLQGATEPFMATGKIADASDGLRLYLPERELRKQRLYAILTPQEMALGRRGRQPRQEHSSENASAFFDKSRVELK
jgi:hypothetical protein